MPLLDGGERYRDLPFASTLCGACGEYCPVKIPFEPLLLELRKRFVAQSGRDPLSLPLRLAYTAMQHSPLMASCGWAYDLIRELAWIHPSSRAWIASRDLPLAPAQTFRSWYRDYAHSRAESRVESRADSKLPAAKASEDTASSCNSHLGPSSRSLYTSHHDKARALSPAATNRNSDVPTRSDALAVDELQTESQSEVQTRSQSDLLELFQQRVSELGSLEVAQVHHFVRASDAYAFARGHMGQCDPERVVVQGQHCEKRAYELAISSASLLVAATGSVILDVQSRQDLWGVMLADTHIVIGCRGALVETLPDAMRVLCHNRSQKKWGGYQLVVTGPSRTADVEKVVVIPAHGPRRLIVIVCDETVDVSGLRHE